MNRPAIDIDPALAGAAARAAPLTVARTAARTATRATAPVAACAVALAGLWSPSSPAGADPGPITAANLAHLEVDDPSALGYYANVDEACGFGDAELALMVEDVLIRNALRPHADARAPEGLNLDLHVACFDPEADGARLFSIRAAFSIADGAGSDLLVNRDYGTFGRGDPAFVELAVDEAVEAALADFAAANARSRAEASI